VRIRAYPWLGFQILFSHGCDTDETRMEAMMKGA